MDELFTRYMYFERAKQGIKNTTTEALRKFYEKDSYAILKNNDTLGMDKQEYQNNQNATSINHFYEKLLLLKDMMNTTEGRKTGRT